MTESLSGSLLGGRYRVGALLGQGGMGAVYEGRQEGLERDVALKVLHSHLAGDKDLISRFKREALAVATLGHPNVVQISDFQANSSEPPFLVMELLRGESLRDLLKRRGTLPPERVAYIFQQVLAALEAAHAKDIVHRDIKPDNIFLCATSVQADLVKILDFGVAKILRQEDPTIGKLTKNGFVVGTLSYMAPEQATGDAIDGRADLYSVGACMYLALTGRKPFDAPTTPGLLKEILTEKHIPLAAARQDIDLGLASIVDRALAKKPGDRFPSAREMASALAAFAKPTPLEATASEAPTLPLAEGPATVAPKRLVPSGAPTVDAKVLAKSAPTAQLKAVPAPSITEKRDEPRQTLTSAGTPATAPHATTQRSVTVPSDNRMSSTPPPRAMGPDTLQTMQIGARDEVEEPSPDTPPPQAIGEGARATQAMGVANPASGLASTTRSQTDRGAPAPSPMENVMTTLKMPARPAVAPPPDVAPPTTAEPVASPSPAPAAATIVEAPRPVPARVQVPVAPRPAPEYSSPNHASVPVIAAAPPPRPTRSSSGGIVAVILLGTLVVGVAIMLGVGIFVLKWFSEAAPNDPAPTVTAPVAPDPSESVTLTPTVSATTSAPDPSASAPKVKPSPAMGTMAVPATSGRTSSTSAMSSAQVGAMSAAVASAIASATPPPVVGAASNLLTPPLTTATATATPTVTVPPAPSSSGNGRGGGAKHGLGF